MPNNIILSTIYKLVFKHNTNIELIISSILLYIQKNEIIFIYNQ